MVGEVAVYVQSPGLKAVTGRLASVLLTPRPPFSFSGEGWKEKKPPDIMITMLCVNIRLLRLPTVGRLGKCLSSYCENSVKIVEHSGHPVPAWVSMRLSQKLSKEACLLTALPEMKIKSLVLNMLMLTKSILSACVGLFILFPLASAEEPSIKTKPVATQASDIDAAVSEGRVGPVEAQLMKLVKRLESSPRGRREAIRAWQKENRVALEAERKARQVASRAETKVGRVPVRVADTVDAKVRAGKLGVLEAKLMKLVRNHESSPRGRREAVRAWQRKNAVALKAEREARHVADRAGIKIATQTPSESTRLEKSVREGKTGPLEAEFIRLLRSLEKNPRGRREAVRAWQQKNGAALDAERRARAIPE